MSPPLDSTARRFTRRALRHNTRREARRSAIPASAFRSTESQLEELALLGMQVSLCVIDLEQNRTVLAGDEFVTLPVAGLGVIPLLIDVAAKFESGALDPTETVDRRVVAPVTLTGCWQHLHAESLPLGDVAVLAAATGDALAANALLARVGLTAVRRRIEDLGGNQIALLDRFRDDRGPDDAPQVALGTARDFAMLSARLAGSSVVSAEVSEQVTDWLCLNHDLSLVASVTGLDPFDHDTDQYPLMFMNKTGRARGVRAETGVIAGPQAGLAYCIIVCFDDLSLMHRLHVHDAFRALGTDLLECVF